MWNKQELIKKINDAIIEKTETINKFLEKSIALDLLLGHDTLYEVDYSNDPPWDHSGKIIAIGKIDLDETSFNEYLDMYNGSSSPSFCSGCGMFHDCNSDDIDYLLTELTFEIQENIIKKEIKQIDRQELYNDFSKHWACPKKLSYDVFEADFKKYEEDIYDYIKDELDGETLAWENYNVVEYLDLYQENPMLQDLVDKHKDEMLKIIENRHIVEKHMRKFVNQLKNSVPDTSDFFQGQSITKEKDKSSLRKAFFKTFSQNEIDLIAYFEPYHFSHSMRFELGTAIADKIHEERKRMERLYSCYVVTNI